MSVALAEPSLGLTERSVCSIFPLCLLGFRPQPLGSSSLCIQHHRLRRLTAGSELSKGSLHTITVIVRPHRERRAGPRALGLRLYPRSVRRGQQRDACCCEAWKQSHSQDEGRDSSSLGSHRDRH